jgi:hypothetical protein
MNADKRCLIEYYFAALFRVHPRPILLLLFPRMQLHKPRDRAIIGALDFGCETARRQFSRRQMKMQALTAAPVFAAATIGAGTAFHIGL